MKLTDADLSGLLPAHIAEDPQFAAAARAIKPHLAAIARSIPNLLIYARLGNADYKNFLPPLRRLAEFRNGLAELDIETLESLAWQFHVDFREVAQTREELAAMVRNSILWHRIKGTPESIHKALAIFGFTGIELEEHAPDMPWASYQLGLPEIISTADIARIVAICREMQPARCRLWRVYNDEWDQRPGIWDNPNAERYGWDNFWWDLYSGVEMPDIAGEHGGLVISFGQSCRFAAQQAYGGDCAFAMSQLFAGIVRYIDHFIWDVAHWDDIFTPSPICAFGQVTATLAGELDIISTDWRVGGWDERPWGAAANYYDRKHPDFEMFNIPQAKSQLVHDDASDKIFSCNGYDDINACWSMPRYPRTESPFTWDDSYWDDYSSELTWELIHEQSLANHAVRMEKIDPDCRFHESRSSLYCASVERGFTRSWLGMWDDKSWKGDGQDIYVWVTDTTSP